MCKATLYEDKKNWLGLVDGAVPVKAGSHMVSAANSAIVFPHIADGGGYTTEFIMFSGTLRNRRRYLVSL